MLIGIGMGFAVKIVFTAFDLAGEFIGTQMGLGFATFYDPQNSAQTPVIAEAHQPAGIAAIPVDERTPALPGHAGTELFGHSSQRRTHRSGFLVNLAELGGKIFSAGLLLSLPVMAALMITNVALAVLTRAAPQLNLFALGFPLTLIGGFFALAISLNYMATPIQSIFEYGMEAMLGYAVPAKP